MRSKLRPHALIPRAACLALLALLGGAACSRAPTRAPSSGPAQGQHLARPFAAPGRCFGKPSKCVSDAQCAPPFALCQEGACCSGTVDPATCECRCGGGPGCGPRELCCDLPAGGAPGPRESLQPGLRCRPIRECFGEG